ncbi:MAG: hypothetical protein ACE14L_10135 [Terriglobales bacterium]
MNALLVAIAMFLTVLLTLAAGIGISYTTASIILRTMAHRPEKAQARALTAAEAGTSGD